MNRPSLVPFDVALSTLLERARPVGRVLEVPTLDAAQRVLAQALVSPLSVPSWDNSQMDGYAVRSSEVAALQSDEQASLPVSQRIPAGSRGTPLVPGRSRGSSPGLPFPPAQMRS